MMRGLIRAMGAAALLLAGAAQAALVAYDGFDYTSVGDQVCDGTYNGGTGNWQQQWFTGYVAGLPKSSAGQSADLLADVFSGSTATPFSTTGLSLGNSDTTGQAMREFAAQDTAQAFNVAATGPADEMFVSFLFRRNAGGRPRVHLGNRASPGLLQFRFGTGPANVLRIVSEGTTTVAGGAVSTLDNTDYFGLIRLSSAENSRQIGVSATIFADASAIPAAVGDVSWIASGSYTPAADNSLFTLYLSHAATNTDITDEFRIGTDYESVTVIPEPATLGLMGLAGVAFLLRRRR